MYSRASLPGTTAAAGDGVYGLFRTHKRAPIYSDNLSVTCQALASLLRARRFSVWATWQPWCFQYSNISEHTSSRCVEARKLVSLCMCNVYTNQQYEHTFYPAKAIAVSTGFCARWAWHTYLSNCQDRRVARSTREKKHKQQAKREDQTAKSTQSSSCLVCFNRWRNNTVGHEVHMHGRDLQKTTQDRYKEDCARRCRSDLSQQSNNPHAPPLLPRAVYHDKKQSESF